MKILGMDTTGNTASVAIANDESILAEISTNYIKNHSIVIMPMIDQCLKMVDMDINDMDYIACSKGPGSFTGVRIGIATAMGLAHGARKKIIPVPTLDALAYNVYSSEKVIVPIMDARRNQVYTGFFKWENGTLKRISEYLAEDIEDVFTMLKEKNLEPIFTGDGVIPFRDNILRNSFDIAPFNMQTQRGGSVACLGYHLAKQNIIVDYADFEPFYIRKPQAEREYEEKLSNNHSF